MNLPVPDPAAAPAAAPADSAFSPATAWSAQPVADTRPAGCLIADDDGAGLPGQARRIDTLLRSLGLADTVTLSACEDGAHAGPAWSLALQPSWAARWVPDADTLGLRAALRETPGESDHAVGGHAADVELDREIAVAQLVCPVRFRFPSAAEFAAAIRVRRRIAQAAARTMLAFDTLEAERPRDCWRYDEARGFTVLPGVALADALRRATQPEETGRLYSFSCYRATEYVILLGIAEELATSNPALLASLQTLSERRAVVSGEFHDVFLREFGTMEAPLPPRFYIPGDRCWFRNPDERSSDIEGFEGSWVIYMGGGLFTNFWERDRPFTLESKCLELHHWADGARQDADGVLRMDESIVAARVARTLRDPVRTAAIQGRMQRYREPRGVYVDGGCIDTTRECPRWLLPDTSDLRLPADH